jgi:hypothetical protein
MPVEKGEVGTSAMDLSELLFEEPSSDLGPNKDPPTLLGSMVQANSHMETQTYSDIEV